MDTDAGTLTGLVVGLFTIWWRLDSKMERKFDTLDNKSDDLSAFLRDTVLEFKGEIGELRHAVPAVKRLRHYQHL